MLNRLPIWIAIGILLNFGCVETAAQSCDSCIPSIQVRVGEPLRLQILNQTSSLVQVRIALQTDSVPLTPGESFQTEVGVDDLNPTILFWDQTMLPLAAVLSQPQPNLLQISLVPGNASGDRSVYVRDDGRVVVF